MFYSTLCPQTSLKILLSGPLNNSESQAGTDFSRAAELKQIYSMSRKSKNKMEKKGFVFVVANENHELEMNN